MTPERFNEILERRLSLARSVLASKAEEYAAGSDRLWNFKRAGSLLDATPEEALLGFLTKHLVSVLDLVEALPAKVPTPERVDEKIGDCINYLVLLEALLAERGGPAAPTEEAPPCDHRWVSRYRSSDREFCMVCNEERNVP